jgi:hypothetical protein
MSADEVLHVHVIINDIHERVEEVIGMNVVPIDDNLINQLRSIYPKEESIDHLEEFYCGKKSFASLLRKEDAYELKKILAKEGIATVDFAIEGENPAMDITPTWDFIKDKLKNRVGRE